jgi:PAS domain S-box-containing protein
LLTFLTSDPIVDNASAPDGDSPKANLPSLAASSDLLSKVVDLAEDAIVSVDEDQRIILFNQGAARIFGYNAGDIIGKPLDILLPQGQAAAHRHQVASFQKSTLTARPMRERQQIRGRRKDGTEFPAEASISKVDADGKIMLTVILRDISQRVTADEKLKDSLREKEALLREIHHRVKNNLQVVSSLLGLQSRALNQEETRKAFQESQNRIHSMALLHEMLCGAGNLSRVDLAEYTRQLTGHLFRSYGVDAQQIRLRTQLDPVYLDLDAAVPYGLITNELITNALRHAFPLQREGEIRVSLFEHKQNVRLIVRDDGIGLPSEDLVTGNSLGFRLVRMLAEQLKAAVEIRPRDPTEIQLTFGVT